MAVTTIAMGTSALALLGQFQDDLPVEDLGREDRHRGWHGVGQGPFIENVGTRRHLRVGPPPGSALDY